MTGVGDSSADRSRCWLHHQAVLHDVDIHVHEDQFTGIVGPSGSGKTTFSGCCSASSGPCRLDRPDRESPDCLRAPTETVNWVLITVLECVLMAGQPADGRRFTLPWAMLEEGEAMEVLERLNIAQLADRQIRRRRWAQQRMFLARALIADRNCFARQPTVADVSTA